MASNTNLNSNSNSKSIIVGIGLVLLSIVILVIFNHQRFNDTKEGFQILETQNDLNIDESLFAVLDDYQDYNSKINSINDEITNYNIQLMDNVLNEAQRNEVKSNKLLDEELERKQLMSRLEKPPDLVRAIKSNYNGSILTTNPYDLNAYQVQINDKCLTVYDDNKYLLEKCNTKGERSDTQKFTTHRIKDIYNAKSITGRNPTKIMEYPYSLFKSELTDQCLTIDDEGVSVQDCLPDNDKQHFKISSEPLLCKGV